MKPRRICMVTTFYPPYNFGGDGMWVYRLTNALARAGHRLTVVFNPHAYHLLTSDPIQDDYPNHPNVELAPLGDPRWGRVGMLVEHQLGRPFAHNQELEHLLSGDFDLIHYHNISLVGGPRVLELGQARKFVTFNDHWFVCPMHILWRFNREPCSRRTCLACTLAGRRPPQLWRYTGLLEKALENVDVFITPSESAVRSHHANGFPHPIRVMPYFLPVPEENATPAETAVESQPLPRSYFLFVGRLEKMKGVQHLIEVFRSYRRAALVIAGTGTFAAELERLAEGLPHVHFTGFLPYDALSRLYRSAVATIVSSIGYETFGFTSLESMSWGTPSIVHDFGPLPEVVSGGGGLVYRTLEELVTHMDAVLDNPNFRDRLGREGRANYQANFTEARHIAMYHDLMEEVL